MYLPSSRPSDKIPFDMTETRSIGDHIRLWLRAIRVYSLPASVVPVVVGGAYAWYATGRFSWGLFLLALAAGMLYHVGANLINDAYDYKHGVDRQGTFGGSGVLVDGSLSFGQVLAAAYLALAMGTGIGFYFVYLHGLPMLAIGVAGFLGAVFYTTTPGSAKYNALGEPLVFVMMGVLMVLGAYLVVAGELTWGALWVSLPVAFLVTAILQANDARDIVDDREAGVTTLAIVLGPERARDFYIALVAATYVSALALVIFGVVPWPALAAFLTLPLAWKLVVAFRENRTEEGSGLVGTIERTAQLHLAFGLLFALGLVAGGFLSS